MLAPRGERAGLRRRIRYGGGGHLLLVLLDSSGSTLKGRGLQQAKGVLAGLTRSAYRQRWRLAVLSFAGERVDTLFAAGRAPHDAERLLARIRGGGGTPLAVGLRGAMQLLGAERRRWPQQRQTLVLLTDGRYRGGHATLPDLGLDGAVGGGREALLVDTEQGAVRLGRARQIAAQLGARYVPIADCARID